MSQQIDDLRDHVRDRYAAAATAVTTGRPASCCGVTPQQVSEPGLRAFVSC